MKLHLILTLLCVFRNLALAEAEIIKVDDHFSTLKTESEGKVIYYTIENDSAEIRLNANNAFFDKGCFRAIGKMKVPAYERKLISAHFSGIEPVRKGSIRWYTWIHKHGKITIRPHIEHFQREDWELQLNNNVYQFNGEALIVEIPKPGKYIISLSYKGNAKSGVKPKVKGLSLMGGHELATEVIRARWRPSAVHCKFGSSTCEQTRLWVFESQSVCDFSNYSPMTTNFGYYGATFSAEGKAKGGMNFSMWVASAKSKKPPALEKTPHLLATGNPEATFSGFGHEGSGVKIRGWVPFAHQPKSVIQALRLDIRGGFRVYSGYFYDEPRQKWVLYAVGRVPVDKRSTRDFLRATSFCEVPGPPQVERTGDQAREIRRRGWFLGEDKSWHVVDEITTSNKNEAISNKFISLDEDGWFTMRTGGVEKYESRTKVKLDKYPRDLPQYLQPNKVAQLYQLPATIGASEVLEIRADSVKLEYNIPDVGTENTAIMYYDTKDCFSFLPRKLHGTEKKGVSNRLYTKDRTWQNATQARVLATRKNEFSLSGLQPHTKYFYRLFIKNKEGKLWSEQAGSFTTKDE